MRGDLLVHVIGVTTTSSHPVVPFSMSSMRLRQLSRIYLNFYTHVTRKNLSATVTIPAVKF